MKKILCVLLVVLMCLTAAPLGGFADLDFGVTASALNATGKCGENAYYTFDSATGKLVISGTGKIYADAFRENIEIKNIIIGDNITKVSAGAFDLCCNLESVCFGDSITEIEYFGFGACSSLTVVALSKDLTIIGDKAFQYCSNLERVILFDNVTSINYQAFFDCFSLESINIPKKVAHIGEGTFRNCYALTDIYYEGSEDEWNKIDIGEKNTGLYNATIHYNATMPYNCEHKNPTIVYKVQPTCINNGMKAHYFCSECNSIVMPSGESYKLYINGITIPATGHEWIHASCTTPKTCNKCGVTEGEALGHTFTAQKIGAKYLKSESTCGKQAVYYYSCAVCGASSAETNDAKTFNYGTAPEHNWGPAQTVPATCTEPEMKIQTCTRCGQKYAKKGSDPALGHSFTNYISDGNATCTVDGTQTAYCDNGCGMSNTIIEEAVGHDIIVNASKEPTCIEDGFTEGKMCAKCGEIIVAQEFIPALKHNEVTKPEKAPTCTKEGLTEGRYCIRCEEYIIPQEEIPALGHDYETKEKSPTCTEDGYYECYCNRCGNGHSVINPAYGHEYEGADLKFTSCTEEGLVEYYCTKCNDTYTETIPATGHNYPDKWSIVIAPDCQNTGFAVKVCFSCHDVIAQTVPESGHSDHDGDSKCDTCNKEIIVVEPDEPNEPDTPDEPEEKPCTCDCHAGGIKAFFFKLINFFVKIFDKNARVCECGKAH